MTRIGMTGHARNLVNRKLSLAGCLLTCMILNFGLSSQSVFADSEFSTAGMNFTGADGTGSLDQSAMNQVEQGYHTGQALDGRAMPKEVTLNNTMVQNVSRPGLTSSGLTNAAGVPLTGSILNGYLGAPGGLGGSRTTQLDKIFGGTPLNKLPKTDTGSFVAQSGMRDDIYGDEGVLGPPPLFDFSTINSGISSKKLTTGHKSNLPSAWGYPN